MPAPAISLSDCWAKTDPVTGRPALTVRDHCMIVGAVAEAIRAHLPRAVQSVLPAGSVVLTAFHDVGKLTFGFQAKCEFWKSRVRENGVHVNRLQNSCGNHAGLSQSCLEQIFGSARPWTKAVGGHHGRFIQRIDREHNGSARIFEPLRGALIAELRALFGDPPDEPPPGDSELTEFPHVAALCGFIILCDWLGSDEDNFPLPARGLESPPVSKEEALAGAAATLAKRGLIQPGLRADRSFGELFTPAGQTPYRPNDLQAACAEHIDGPGLYVVEAPMGMGKTEAALDAAARLVSSDRAAGLYFALPTQLTSNKIHERVEAFLANALPDGASATLALAHSASWLHDRVTLRIAPASGCGTDDDQLDPRAARSWFTSRRALLARYGVGTIDQALMGALPVKFAALRLFGLAGKVVVFDEVHTYDAYTGRLLDRLIDHLLALRCTVIVLSATLTTERRAGLIRRATTTAPSLPAAYPLLTCCRPGEAVESVEVAYPGHLSAHAVAMRRIELAAPDLPESLVEEIQARARRGECVLVIRNTVALAQETFAALRQEGIETGLLHSRFAFHVRNGHPDPLHQDPAFPDGREAAWVARLGKEGPRPEGCILVATQVAEQSLDIDADLLVTDLCPADMLLQRVGRLWRHMTQRPAASRPGPNPETWVVVPALPADGNAEEIEKALRPHSAIYAPYVLLRTLRELPATLHIPAGIRRFLEAVYAPAAPATDPAAWADLRKKMEDEIETRTGQGSFLTANPYFPPGSDDESRALTRYREVETIDLVLLASAPRTLPGGAIELRFHSGETLQWRPGQPWTFLIARAAFLSTVRVACYLVPKESPPDWLALHTHGPVLGAFLRDGQLVTVTQETSLPLRFEPDRGLVHEKMLAERSRSDCDIFTSDEDDSWF